MSTSLNENEQSCDQAASNEGRLRRLQMQVLGGIFEVHTVKLQAFQILARSKKKVRAVNFRGKILLLSRPNGYSLRVFFDPTITHK